MTTSIESFSRRAFSERAIRAIEFMCKKTGYYEMSDVLKLGKVLGDYVERGKRKLSRRYKYLKDETKETQESWA